MAAKSDFAQKLLHDLRLRKERMAAAQNSSSSNLTSRGAHGSPGPAYKGSRQVKALEPVGPRSGGLIRKTSSGTGQLHIGDSSNQIVLYGKGRSSEHIGDLSTALAFAFGNGGKFNKIDASGGNPMLNFLQRIGRRSLDTGRMDIVTNIDMHTSTTQFPSFSHIHIHEISKGVQKLNQILRACSNGLNFDRYSVEVGKELLRGAMDLEESLRMLVNLQEASDYMINSQRKNKIKLIEEDEDDETETAKEIDLKQLARPRFSFDKPNRKSQSTKEAPQNGIKQQLMALTYPEETPKLQEKQPRSRSNSFSHARSATCVPDLKALSTYLEPNGHSISHSKPEKGRIPNVIAKLMGLEELAPKDGSKTTPKEMRSKKKEKTVSLKSQTPAESQAQETGSNPPTTANKNALSSNKSATRDARLMMEAENFQSIPNGSSPVVVSHKNSRWQDFEAAARKDASPGSKRATVASKQQNRISQHDETLGYTKVLQEKEKAEDNKEDKEKNIRKAGERKDLFLNDVPLQNGPDRHRLSEGEDVSEENVEVKRNANQTANRTAIQTKNSNGSSIHTSKQQKHHNHMQQPQMLERRDHPEGKNRQQPPKQRLQAREHKGNQVESIVTLKAKNRPKSSQKKQSSANLATAAANQKNAMKHIEVKPSKDLANSRHHKHRAIHSVHFPRPHGKANYTKTLTGQTHQKEDAAVNKINGTYDDQARSINHQSPIPQEKKQQKDEKLSHSNGVNQETNIESEEANLGIRGLDKPDVSTEPLKRKDSLDNECEEQNFSNSGEEDYALLEASKSQTCDDNSNEMTPDIQEIPEDQQHGDKATMSSNDFPLNSQKALHIQLTGMDEVSRGISNVVRRDHTRIPPTGAAELLTESEKHLKEKLIKGQLFLNTAEAIFKLNIPVSILHGHDHIGRDTETKLILDCGYELLKKKGQRQEFSVYPCKGMSISYIKVRSLDNLVKQLSKDFDVLKFYGGTIGSQDCDAADYLHKMLEKDFRNWHADVSSMWDFGWNEKTFAFLEKDDLVKDLEKHILNGLLDEITRNLLHIAVSA
ncbi:uncharacterized protein [Coffea arabica]|uniref:DUF3741 domain-containing protein n=1 Tax=Coffea arabica TaxID=13443 RepID=A0ABM4VTD7_COFAR